MLSGVPLQKPEVAYETRDALSVPVHSEHANTQFFTSNRPEYKLIQNLIANIMTNF
jgi:hypothetical protein